MEFDLLHTISSTSKLSTELLVCVIVPDFRALDVLLSVLACTLEFQTQHT